MSLSDTRPTPLPSDAVVETVARAIGGALTVTVYEDDGQGRFVSQNYEAEIDIDGVENAARAALTALTTAAPQTEVVEALTEDQIDEIYDRLRLGDAYSRTAIRLIGNAALNLSAQPSTKVDYCGIVGVPEDAPPPEGEE